MKLIGIIYRYFNKS